MEPVKPVGANREFLPPENWDEKIMGPCDSLHVRVAYGTITSAWRPTEEEITAIRAGQPILIRVYADALPPFMVGVQSIYDDGTKMIGE